MIQLGLEGVNAARDSISKSSKSILMDLQILLQFMSVCKCKSVEYLQV